MPLSSGVQTIFRPGRNGTSRKGGSPGFSHITSRLTHKRGSCICAGGVRHSGCWNMSGCGFNPSPYLVRQLANDTIEVLPSRLQENKNHLGAPFSPFGSRHIQFSTFGPSPRPQIFNQVATASQEAHSPAPSLICTRYETQHRPRERPGFFTYQALPIQSILLIQQRRHQPGLKRQDSSKAYMAHWPCPPAALSKAARTTPVSATSSCCGRAQIPSGRIARSTTCQTVASS